MWNSQKEIIKNEIENLRMKLNEKTSKGREDILSDEVLQLSQRLDELILEYIRYDNNI